MIKRFKAQIIFSAIIALSFFLYPNKIKPQTKLEDKKEYQYLSLFSEIVSLVKTSYVDEINPQIKFPGAFSSMLKALDPFSTYLNRKETEVYLAYRDGYLCSSGIFGTKISNYFYITDIITGSAADKAGLQIGDRIKSINDASIFTRTLWQTQLGLQSAQPSKIKLEYLKKKSADKQIIMLDSRLLDTRPKFEVLKDNILLIKILRFDKPTIASLDETLRKQNKPLKFILDLRKYSGGDFDSFKKLAKMFFRGPISLVIKSKVKEDIFQLGSREAFDYSAVVIINQSTIMHAALLAHLFKNYAKTPHHQVTLVGSHANGFISKLKHIKFNDGSSILLTEAYYLLEGKKTASIRVAPDITIDDEKVQSIVQQSMSILIGKRQENKAAENGQ